MLTRRNNRNGACVVWQSSVRDQCNVDVLFEGVAMYELDTHGRRNAPRCSCVRRDSQHRRARNSAVVWSS